MQPCHDLVSSYPMLPVNNKEKAKLSGWQRSPSTRCKKFRHKPTVRNSLPFIPLLLAPRPRRIVFFLFPFCFLRMIVALWVKKRVKLRENTLDLRNC